MPPDVRDLRNAMKQKRRSLSAAEVAVASAAIVDKTRRLSCLQRANAIAIYLPAFGEVDCSGLIDALLARGKRVLAPILRKNRLVFAPFDYGTEFTANGFGIMEPVYQERALLTARQLDVVITPLVAFDARLNRLGMGGGYYDRTFAFRKRLGVWRRPLLIGVAYSFQRVDKLQANAWDVPLDVVITEKESFGSY